MRLTLLLVLLVFSVSSASSQTILENPKTGMSTASNVKIEKIELRDSATVLWFHVFHAPGNWISVPGGSFIQPLGSKEKLYITTAEGIQINEQFTMPASGETSYKLFFPKLEASVSTIDFGEANDGGSWFIYDIQLKPAMFKSLVPEQITGNWFRSDNAQWEISLFDSVAVYKSQVWKYSTYSEKEGVGKFSLKNGTKSQTIYTKTINDSTCLIGETPEGMIKYAHQPDESAIKTDNETYELPVFRIDTVTYCGYINGFSPRFPQRTGMVYVNDVLTGEQTSHLLKIADDGTFKVQFLHTNPQGVFIRFPFSFETVFVEPGKTTFQLIDNGYNTNLFMGDCARINTDLLKLKHINSFNYNQMMEKVLDFSLEQYKAWILELQLKDKEALENFAHNHSISEKAIQVKEIDIEYNYAAYIFEYGWNVDAAWRKKNNIPQDQREIPFKPAKPDTSYYSFLTNELANNPLGVLSSNYSSFINRLKFMEILREAPKGYSIPEVLAEMDKAGYQLSPEQEELAIQMKGVDSPEKKKVQEEFEQKYGQQFKDFRQKYAEKLKVLFNEKKGAPVTADMMEAFLIGQNVEFTPEEKTMLIAQKEFNEHPLVKKANEFKEQFKKEISQFQSDHRDFVNELFRKNSITTRKENLQKILGIQIGLATDIMTSQDICRPIVAEMTPSTEAKLKESLKEITTPFIANYIVLRNNETLAKIEANKKLAGSNVNEVPKTAGDKVFDAIMEKYKGKVVYVDFWATWCAPCRSGIEQIKPLKDEMVNEKVAFVYITNQTSPQNTYDNMIPTIKGEHFRVSADEWNVLSGMFNISGIPHCVLVGKDGKVINPHLGHLENSTLKAMLIKHINQ